MHCLDLPVFDIDAGEHIAVPEMPCPPAVQTAVALGRDCYSNHETFSVIIEWLL
jgi:hypothetical protein